jgi:flagellar hook-associated protein 1 FlgK
MIGLNAGLEIAKKALSAYQLALSVYGNNVANVETPGFTRRRPELIERQAVDLTVGRIGLGVDIQAVTRMRDRLLDETYRGQSGVAAKYEAMESAFGEIEAVLNEPSDSGLLSTMAEFWNSWQELANQPESTTARQVVADSATALSRALNSTDARLDRMRGNIDSEIRAAVAQVNSLATRIADLNGAVVRGEVTGEEMCDLRDLRDRLLDELSGLVDVRVFEREDGSVSVVMGSEALVERTNTVSLGLATEGQGTLAVSQVTIGNGARVIRPAGGKLAGLIEMRDSTIPQYQARLDTIARTLVENLNAAHAAGYGLGGQTGSDFFDPAGVTASTIKVSDAILGDLSLIAASADGSPGNSDTAMDIADLRLAALIGDATIDDYYGATVGSLGIESSRVTQEKESQSLMLQEIANRRESVKGVSLDEEMANMIAAQHAFEAAAKMVSIIDGLMSSLISTV